MGPSFGNPLSRYSLFGPPDGKTAINIRTIRTIFTIHTTPSLNRIDDTLEIEPGGII